MIDAMQDAYPPRYDQEYPDVGLGIDFLSNASDASYDRIHNSVSGTSGVYYDANSSRSSSPYIQASPPTPHSTHSDAGVRTRSGRKVPPGNANSPSRASSKTRQSRSPRPARKPKAAKAEKLKIPKLTEPISVLTKDMDVPVKDMDAWVNRSAETRHKEVEERKGYVTRPMNSFMLYRSAYAERLKQWGVHNNHQVVSSMAGESWPLEPPEIRDHYNDLAKLERTNHQNAHPNYKFSPSKAASPKKRKGGEFESDEEVELSDSDDPDAEWSAGRRQRSTRQRQFDEPMIVSSSPYVQQSSGSLWDSPIDGKPLPQAISVPYVDQRYYAPGLYQQYAMPTMDDIRARQMEHHSLSYPTPISQQLVGLPGGQHNDLLQTIPAAITPPPSRDVHIDPAWAGYLGGFADTMTGHTFNAASSEYPVPSDFLGTGQEHWHVDPSLHTLDSGGQHEGWMDNSLH